MATDVIPTKLPSLEERTLAEIAALSETLQVLARIVPSVASVPVAKFASAV